MNLVAHLHRKNEQPASKIHIDPAKPAEFSYPDAGIQNDCRDIAQITQVRVAVSYQIEEVHRRTVEQDEIDFRMRHAHGLDHVLHRAGQFKTVREADKATRYNRNWPGHVIRNQGLVIQSGIGDPSEARRLKGATAARGEAAG